MQVDGFPWPLAVQLPVARTFVVGTPRRRQPACHWSSTSTTPARWTNRDPAVTDGFAKDREVILFNNAGISSSSGDVPTSVEEMAANAAAFIIKALDPTQVDVLGFSLGGLVAQELALAEPKLVRRLVLVGTGPRSGESMATGTPEGQKIFGATYARRDEN